jgi:hypothetical protein
MLWLNAGVTLPEARRGGRIVRITSENGKMRKASHASVRFHAARHNSLLSTRPSARYLANFVIDRLNQSRIAQLAQQSGNRGPAFSLIHGEPVRQVRTQCVKSLRFIQ